MKNLETIMVPLMGENGLEHLVFRPSEWGDKYSVVIEIPCGIAEKRKLVLPRRFFAKSLLKDLKT